MPIERRGRESRESVRVAVEAAAELGVDMVCTFPGHDDAASEDDNYHQIAEYYAPLVERAATGNVKVVLENWPGGRINYVATTPAGWTRLLSSCARRQTWDSTSIPPSSLAGYRPRTGPARSGRPRFPRPYQGHRDFP